MITLNTIVKRFEDFADNHFFIRSFSFGGPEDVDLEYYRRRGLPHIIFRRNGARMYRYLTASVLSWLADREHGREDRHAVDQAVSLDFNP